MANSIPSFFINAAAVTARNAESTDTPLSDVDGDGTTANPYLGCNRGGSNAPGIGIATGVVSAATELISQGNFESWTIEDQAELGRTPQDSQHIGGIIDAAPEYAGVPYPTPAEAGATTIQFAQDIAIDYNDTANFVIADVAAVDGAEMDTVTGAINDTGETISIGNVVWGRVPVA